MAVKREAVKSSNVKSVGYCSDCNGLYVEFNGGGVYKYQDVPAETQAEVMKADSVGSFIHRQVKPAYKVKRVA